MKTSALLFALYAWLLLSSCAVGRKLSFDATVNDPGYTPKGKLAIVFQDKRENVLSGKEKPSFCGHVYGGYAIAYNVQTQSGKPLANDFSQMLKNTLEQKGVPVTAYYTDPPDTVSKTVELFQQSDNDKLLYFTITRWESRCTANFANMRYEANGGLKLSVLDKKGNLLGEQEIKDQLVKEQGAGLNMKVLQQQANELLNKLMNELMNHEKIKPLLL